MKMRHRGLLAVAAVWFLAWFANPVLSQSFDCAGAASATEKEICDSDLLGDLDTELAGLYQSALAKADNRSARELKDAQRQWIAQRNACGNSFICIDGAYRERIEELIEIYELFPGWAGIYEDRHGGLQFRITETADANYEIEFSGIGADYTCGPVTGTGNVEGVILRVSFEDGPFIDIRRLGTGLYVLESIGSRDLQSENCGARAPQLAERVFLRR